MPIPRGFVEELFVNAVRHGGCEGMADAAHICLYAEAGSVQWMFQQKGAISVLKSVVDEDTLLGVVLDAGAEDATTDDAEVYEITTSTQAFEAVKAALQAKNIPTQAAELAKVPQNTIALSEKDAEQALKLMEALEDNDDVQRVSSNLDIADEVLAKLQT